MLQIRPFKHLFPRVAIAILVACIISVRFGTRVFAQRQQSPNLRLAKAHVVDCTRNGLQTAVDCKWTANCYSGKKQKKGEKKTKIREDCSSFAF
jgi:hypothetical protein